METYVDKYVWAGQMLPVGQQYETLNRKYNLNT